MVLGNGVYFTDDTGAVLATRCSDRFAQQYGQVSNEKSLKHYYSRLEEVEPGYLKHKVSGVRRNYNS